MAQATLHSFFTQKKRQKPAEAQESKQRKVEKSGGSQKIASSKALASFVHGKYVPSSTFNDVLKERHAEFYNYFTAPRRSKNKDGLENARRKMKPYDLQFIELKRQNMEAILIIQNGYKYQILGEDAHIVSRILGRSPISGWRTLDDEGQPTDALYDRFASLTFPIERLPFYVEKLVMQGFKVAVAKQLETSALKAQGDNKRGPFKREVTNTYTKGTMVEELTASSVVCGHLLALKQAGKSRFVMVAVQPATGDAVYDSFEDSSTAMELETRLLHIQPSEILVIGDLEPIAMKLVGSLNIRVAIQPETPKYEEDAPSSIKDDSHLLSCYSNLRSYLSEFKLDHALTLDLHPFTLQSYMYLNGNTLQCLEIFENQTTSKCYGSLLWVLDVTKTAFGRRLLRNWIGKPLMDRGLLAERVEAMEEIMNSEGLASQLFSSVRNALPRLPDLERYVLQIFHGRIAPRQLYWCLHFFNFFLTSITEPQIKAAKLKSSVLQSIFASLYPTRHTIEQLLRSINSNYARNNRESSCGLNLASYFNLNMPQNEDTSQSDEFADLENLELRIAQCRSDFTKFLITESIKLGVTLRQVKAVGEEDTFVIGVSKKEVSKIPTTWRRQGAITSEVRYWAPFSIEQTKILKPLLEQQAIIAKETYDKFVRRIAEKSFDELRRCVCSLANLDCLLSLSAVSSRPQHVKPDIVDEPCLEIEDGRHPILERTMLSTVIPNSAEMYRTKNRVMIITGANMGGKSSYVRQIALLVIMAQIGCYVPASRARLSIMDGIFTRMGAFDNILRGESTFMIELKECAAIMEKATPRSMVILDEIGRGTSTLDGVAIADAVLQYMIENVKAFTLFITHYPLLCQKASAFGPEVNNWSIDCAENENDVTFLYKVVPRQASRSYGINVARLAGLPSTILKTAQTISEEFEQRMEMRKGNAMLLKCVSGVIHGTTPIQDLYDIVPNSEEVCETQI